MAETKGTAKTTGESADPEQVEQPPEQPSAGFPIVGIGASAGGCRLSKLFSPPCPKKILAWPLFWSSI